MTIGRFWTDDELSMLREHYPVMYTDELSEMMGRSEDAIRSKAKAMGLRKSSTYDRRVLYGRYTHKGRYSIDK